MIYTPLSCIKQNNRATPGAYQTCTKIMYGSFEISIAMDQSCGSVNDLHRAEIRIYGGTSFTKDCTDDFLARHKEVHGDDINIFTTPEDLFWIMNEIQGK